MHRKINVECLTSLGKKGLFAVSIKLGEVPPLFRLFMVLKQRLQKMKNRVMKPAFYKMLEY